MVRILLRANNPYKRKRNYKPLYNLEVMQLTGFQEFLKLFGDITVLNVVEIILAGVFLFFIYKKIRDYLIKKHDADKKRDEELKEALEAVRKYPEYRQQSIKIQQLLEGEIQELRTMQEESMNRLMQMEEQTERRERNKLRDRLLQNYRYYTNKESNPSQSWTRMESEAFWELFRDYEDAGGDGYVHSEVQPAMERLTIIEHEKK